MAVGPADPTDATSAHPSSEPTPEPTADPTRAADPTDAASAPAQTSSGGGASLRALQAPLLALLVALVALAAVAVVTLPDPGARDRDARAAVAQARGSLEQLLSYDYRSVDQHAQQTAGLLTGSFRDEYASTLTERIAPLAVDREAVVVARTSEAGVMAQTEDTVTVQVFVDQATTAAGEEQPSVDQNRVIATMRRVGDRWLIERLSAY